MRAVVAFVALAATLGAAGASAALTPSRTIVAPLPVQDLALSERSIAYVADVPEALHCSRIGYWNTGARQALTIDSRELCRDEASTGQGVWDLSVATNRLLWITYAGGNFRDWFLWTATTTRKTPRRLRFVARDVDAPPPIVLGPGTPQGVPYAVDDELVYLAGNGKTRFRTQIGSPVRALATLTTGLRFAIAVAALLATNEVVTFDVHGRELSRRTVGPGVSALAIDDRFGVAYQQGRVVRFFTREPLTLPVGATMVDVAQGRILWERAGDLGATTIATGRSTRLVDGSPARPVHGQLEPNGLAWAQGRALRWRAGPLP